MQGRRHDPSAAAVLSWQRFQSLGFNLGQLVAGRLDVRGDVGAVIRWGEGWFFEVRDGGLGWLFDKNDQASIDERVEILIKLFHKKTNILQPLLDVQEAVADSIVGSVHAIDDG